MSTYEVTVPILWLKKASKQRGKALAVSLALLNFVGCQLDKVIVADHKSVFSPWSLNRVAARRGLKSLEKAGLVSVTRCVGKTPVIQLINYKPMEGEQNGTAGKVE